MRADPTILESLFARLRVLNRLPTAARYVLATLMVAAAFLLRAALEPALEGYPFLIFLDAVVLAALLLDRGAGVYAAGLSTAGAAYFVPPVGSFAVGTASGAAALLLYAATALTVALLIGALRRTVGRLADEAAEKGREAEARELLVLEIGHRVKNNLQSVAGLTQLQAARDPAARASLEALGRRVMVMARVHDRLSVRGDGDAVARVDAGLFVRDLANDLRASLAADRPVTLTVDAGALELEPDRATSLGLIVNELLTNALKHAFPAGRSGTVTVRLRREGGDAVLEVADDGVGSPKPRPDGGGAADGKGKAGGRSGLGTTLVTMLARQLDGRVEAGPAGGDAAGTTVRVRFPCPGAGEEGGEPTGSGPAPKLEPVDTVPPVTSPPATPRPA